MTYELQGVTSVDGASVQVGPTPSHVALRAPHGRRGGAAVTLEPQSTSSWRAPATAGDLRITLTGGLQRWDLPDWSQELPADRQAMTVDYDATFLGDFPGGFPFTGENVAPAPAGRNGSCRRGPMATASRSSSSAPARRSAGLFSRFEIPAGVDRRGSR